MKRWRDANREKLKESHKRWYEDHKEQRRAAYKGQSQKHNEQRFLRKYGISRETGKALLAAQGDVCAICGSTSPSGRHGWVTDHDHRTMTVRGILCNPCNLALGLFQDSKEILSRALSYLSVRVQRAS